MKKTQKKTQEPSFKKLTIRLETKTWERINELRIKDGVTIVGFMRKAISELLSKK